MKKYISILVVLLMVSCVGHRQFDLTENQSKESDDLFKVYPKPTFGKNSIPTIDRNSVLNDPAKEAPAISSAKGELKLIETGDKISLAPSEEFIPADQNYIRDVKKENKNVGKTRFFNQVYHSFKKKTNAFLFLGLAGLASIGLIKAGEKKSKQLTHWSKRNPIISRSILVGAQSAATLGGLALGHTLYSNGLMIPEATRWIPVGIFTAAASFYPNKFYSGNIPAFTYMRRKVHDVALYTTGAMMMTYAGNHYSLSTVYQPVESVVVSASNPFKKEDKLSLIKKNFETRIESKDELKPMTKSEAAGAITGAIIGFIFLAIAVAGLSCSLSCSGNEGAAALVLIGGEGLLIWGLVSILKRIKARRKLGENGPTLQNL